VTFNPVGLPAQFASIGNAINAIQTARSSPGFAPIASALFDLPDQQALSKFYNAVGGGGTAGTQQASFTGGTAFTTMMFDQIGSWVAGSPSSNGVVYDDRAMAYAAVSPADVIASSAFKPAPLAFSDRWRAWAAPLDRGRRSTATLTSGRPALL
jgi:uncharacterized protein with beta-barrel porin domain